jgi:hypothetical protein
VKDDVDHVVLARSMSMPSFRAYASSSLSLSLLRRRIQCPSCRP